MLLTVLDSLPSARTSPGQGADPIVRLATQRSLKICALLGYRIDLGEPQVVDNAALLQETADDAGFLPCLKRTRLRYSHRDAGPGRGLLPALLDRLRPSRVHASAWAVDTAQGRSLRTLEPGTTSFRDIQQRFEPGGFDHRMIDAVRAWSEVLGSPAMRAPIAGGVERDAAMIPHATSRRARSVDEPDGLERIIAAMTTAVAAAARRGHDPVGAAGELVELEARVRSRIVSADPSRINDRTRWLGLAGGLAGSSGETLCELPGGGAPASRDERAAVALRDIVNGAYANVLAISWRSDALYASDVFTTSRDPAASEPPASAAVDEMGLLDTIFEHAGATGVDYIRTTPSAAGLEGDEAVGLDALSWSRLHAYLGEEETVVRQNASRRAANRLKLTQHRHHRHPSRDTEERFKAAWNAATQAELDLVDHVRRSFHNDRLVSHETTASGFREAAGTVSALIFSAGGFYALQGYQGATDIPQLGFIGLAAGTIAGRHKRLIPGVVSAEKKLASRLAKKESSLLSGKLVASLHGHRRLGRGAGGRPTPWNAHA